MRATKALIPSPAANAKGKLATAPIVMERTPATKAVVAAIIGRFDPSPGPPPRKFPSISGVNPKISGLSTIM